MDFCDKLKKLRKDNNLTQEEFAEKIFVTRTAVSKWETGNGYPSLESLKLIADLFQMKIDELLSDDDIENKKLLDKKRSEKMYFIAVMFLVLSVIFAILSVAIKLPFLMIGSVICVAGYIIFAILTKPKYKRTEEKGSASHIISVIIPAAIFLFIFISLILQII